MSELVGEQHFSTAAVAKKLGVSPDLIRAEMDRGELRYVRLGNRRVVSQSAYDEYVASRTVARAPRHLKAVR